MAKSSGSGYRCAECGWQSAKWAGRCGECQAWGTVQEVMTAPRLARASREAVRAAVQRGPLTASGVTAGGVPGSPASAMVLPIGKVDATDAAARPTGMDEFDRVLGGGLVPGAVLLLAGEPGVGKSTLLLETCAQAAGSGPVLYVTGEESAAQVRLRADRIGALHPGLFLAAESGLPALLGHVAAVRPQLLVVDSVQTIAAPGAEGTPGGVTQVRAVAAALAAVAKERMMTTVLVGHVTKDGAIAGPRALEHLVDVVLHFDGDRHSQLRIVRAVKNRFGPTDEIGCFDLGEYGLIGLPDPSGLFLSQRSEPVPGTCVTVALEGSRALVAEVQALVGFTQAELPRRVTSGLDASRVGMLVAVLKRRTRLKLAGHEIYAATVGGVRLSEPSVDLAVALAIASTTVSLSIPRDVVAIGEVGLAGEVRRVPGLARRVAEAQRLGFRRAIVPAASGALPPPVDQVAPGEPGDPIEIREVEDVTAAIAVALGDGGASIG
jgi:DNA repair protein RadA/Sms